MPTLVRESELCFSCLSASLTIVWYFVAGKLLFCDGPVYPNQRKNLIMREAVDAAMAVISKTFSSQLNNIYC